jgi:cytosine/adenosine deaminase-related metal-dependent hydrolase
MIGQGKPTEHGMIRDHGAGVLFPALINTHTHLELCALRGRIATHKGFGFWVRELIEKRAMIDNFALLEAAESGIREIYDSACGAVGEISSLGLTRELFEKSALAGVWFREYLGNAITIPEISENRPGHAMISLAGHAPHTTSPKILTEIKRQTRSQNMPFSIHAAESDDETTFLTAAQGPWKEFLLCRGIDPASWGLPAKSPVRHLQSIGILDDRTILVHVLHADQTDLNVIQSSGAHVCLCPRSNLALHGRLPDMDGMIQSGIPLCLGTDSLASVNSLSLFDEMACLSDNFPTVAPELIFQMATHGGAAALGIDSRMGSLRPGKEARQAYLDIHVSKSSQIIEALIRYSRMDKRS